MTHRLSCSSLVKTYGERNVVDGISLEINSGEVVGILGPNGAGKTTTFYMLVGLVKPTGGKIFIDTAEISQLPMHKRSQLGLGYLPQEPSVFKKLSVYDNVKIIAENLNISKREMDLSIHQILEEFRILQLANQKAYTLSGGERRRLEIARTLITKPKFLLLDEPFSGVDPISVTEIQNIISELKTKNIGVVITDHNVRETLSIVDRAYLVYDGSILYHGTSTDLLHDPNCRRVYLGEKFSM